MAEQPSMKDVLNVRDDIAEIAHGLTKAVERDPPHTNREEWLNRARQRIGRFMEALLQSRLSPNEMQKKKIEVMTDLIAPRIRGVPIPEIQVYFAASEALAERWREACRTHGVIGMKYEATSISPAGDLSIECYDTAREVVGRAKQWSDQEHLDIRVKDQSTGQVYREQTLLDLYREVEGS
jgi:hypothetical protein